MNQRTRKIVISANIAMTEQRAHETNSMDRQIEKSMVSHERELKMLKGFAPLAFQLLTPDEWEYSPARTVGLTELAMERALQLVLNRPAEPSGPASLLNGETPAVNIAQIAQALGMRPSVMLPDLRRHIVQHLLRAGWVRQKKQVDLVRAWLYVRPGQ